MNFVQEENITKIGLVSKGERKMMIVKLTVLSILITAIFVIAIRIWASAYPGKYLTASITKKYPKWFYLYVLFVLLDIIGVFASAIYLLFIR